MVLVLLRGLTGWWLDQSLLTLRGSSTRAQNDQTILSRHADEVKFQEPRSCGLKDPPESFLSYGQNCEPYSKANCWVHPDLTLARTQGSQACLYGSTSPPQRGTMCSQYLLNVVPMTLKEDLGCHRAIKSFWLWNILHNFMYLKIHMSIMFLLQIISKIKIGSGAGSWPNFQNGRS